MTEFAHFLHERGLHQRLWELLEGHEAERMEREEFLFWRLSSAVRLGREQTVRNETVAYLEENEAPDLRALHASIFLEPAAARNEIARAYRAKRTTLTAYLHGRALPRARDGVRVLGKAVKLAENAGHPYEVSRAAGTLAARLIDAGEFSAAATWGKWALSYFDRHDLSDAQRRLYILNNWAYARLLDGDHLALEELLRGAEEALASAFHGLREMFRSTLGDYLLATERAEEALDWLRPIYYEAPRKMKGIRGLGLVRALLELGREEREEALEAATVAHSLTRLDPWEYHRSAELALGMVLALEEPARAVPHLQKVLHFEPLTLPAPQRAQATLFLAFSSPDSSVRKTLNRELPLLRKLSETGLRLLSGPESRFSEIWAICTGPAPGLELRFLGRQEVLVEGVPRHVGISLKNILALLAYHSDGIGTEALLSELGLSKADKEWLYSAVSQLRSMIPVSSPPYRLELNWRADFVEVSRLLEHRKLRKALELYRGPLLPDSEAYGIEEIRNELEEKLRQAALVSDDAEACYALAGTIQVDLELWERAAELLDENDTRFLKARTRVSRLTREF